ncbi:hypothetical protein QQ045_026006 [Rhodiola kirilowii]
MEDVDDDHRTPKDGRITVTLPKSSSGGGAREDCWSEAATSILIDAWGERYLALSRGNLKQKHWKEVADIVNGSREMHGRSPKTDMQCKNRIDTVKKKYKLEKSKIACSDAAISRWPFFHMLDHLIGPATKTYTPSAVIPRLQNNQKMQRQPAPDESDSLETETPDSRESTESYPPKPAKKRRMSIPNSTATSNPKGRKSHDGGRVKKSSSIKELTNAILNLGEAYEQAENAKLRQVVEMEKHRMKFMKDLELQRMQLFMKTQLGITQMKQNAMSSCRNKAGSNHFHHQLHMKDNNHVNNNVSNLNSDST